MKKTARDLINRLANVESKFFGKQFLAPAIAGGQINVRLGDAVCKMKIAPDDYHGFGIFEAISFTEAILVRDATLAERRAYLELLPVVPLIATLRKGDNWLGVAFRKGDRRFQINGLVPIQITENVNLFDVIECRFDGSTFWFDRPYSRSNLRHADLLRKSLIEEVEPKDMQVSGLVGEHRTAYELNYLAILEARRPKPLPTVGRLVGGRQSSRETSDNVQRVRRSLSHAGASLVAFQEQHGAFQVTYRVGDRQFTSAIDRENLGLISAGVCLDGYDQEFDLASLVGVLREGMDTGQV